MEKYGISHQMLCLCRALYGERYKDDLRRLRSSNHAKVMKGNQRGLGNTGSRGKHKIKTLLDPEALASCVALGLADVEIARRLGTTEHHVRKNIQHYDITRTHTLPMCLKFLDATSLDVLERAAPGFKAAAEHFYTEPHAFFLHVYSSMLRLRFLLEDLRSFRKSHDYYVQAGKIPRDHISWSLNINEMRLSDGLIAAGVLHQRNVCFHENYCADFMIGKTLIEVDGEFHAKDSATKARDKIKQAHADRLGFVVLRFTTQRVRDDLEGVVCEIQAALSAK
jgi:very-short-patch-repair endonuclease